MIIHVAQCVRCKSILRWKRVDDGDQESPCYWLDPCKCGGQAFNFIEIDEKEVEGISPVVRLEGL
jgi:hypothetical protein